MSRIEEIEAPAKEHNKNDFFFFFKAEKDLFISELNSRKGCLSICSLPPSFAQDLLFQSCKGETRKYRDNIFIVSKLLRYTPENPLTCGSSNNVKMIIIIINNIFLNGFFFLFCFSRAVFSVDATSNLDQVNSAWRSSIC